MQRPVSVADTIIVVAERAVEKHHVGARRAFAHGAGHGGGTWLWAAARRRR
jgi:hypothetical protein